MFTITRKKQRRRKRRIKWKKKSSRIEIAANSMWWQTRKLCIYWDRLIFISRQSIGEWYHSMNIHVNYSKPLAMTFMPLVFYKITMFLLFGILITRFSMLFGNFSLLFFHFFYFRATSLIRSIDFNIAICKCFTISMWA